MDLGLKDKSVLVTGGSKGIGLAIAELFAAEGASVAICARNADQVANVVKSLAAKGVKSWGKAIDVADPVALKLWIEGAAGELGGIDTIVCSVSALAVGDSPEPWEKWFRTDMMHTVNSVAAAVPYLEKSKSASIIIVSSVSGFEVDFAAGSYGAFKAALIHYAKGLSSQLIAKGIRVNAVSPGNTYFEGGIWQNIERGMPDLYKTAMPLNPTGRMSTAQQLAAAVLFLPSPVGRRMSSAEGDAPRHRGDQLRWGCGRPHGRGRRLRPGVRPEAVSQPGRAPVSGRSDPAIIRLLYVERPQGGLAGGRKPSRAVVLSDAL